MGGNGDAADGDLVKFPARSPSIHLPLNAWTVADTRRRHRCRPTRHLASAQPRCRQTRSTPCEALTPYDASPWTGSGGCRNSNRLGPASAAAPRPICTTASTVWVGGSMLPGTSPDGQCSSSSLFCRQVVELIGGRAPGQDVRARTDRSADLDGHRLNDAMFPWGTAVADVLDIAGSATSMTATRPGDAAEPRASSSTTFPRARPFACGLFALSAASPHLQHQRRDCADWCARVFGTPLGTSMTVSSRYRHRPRLDFVPGHLRSIPPPAPSP